MNKKKNKPGDVDILLTDAFGKYCLAEDEGLPTDKELREAFPPSEEKTLIYGKKAQGKERASSAAKILTRAAAVVLAAISVTFAALMMDENVRAAVTGSIVKFFDSEVRISFRDPDDTGNENGERISTDDVTFGYIPEGLTFTELEKDKNHPNYRHIRMGEMNDFFDTVVIIYVFPTDEMNPGFSAPTWDKVYLSEVNGMDAFMIDDECEIGERSFSARSIVFGDGDISIMMSGINISREELKKTAENIKW